MSRAASAPPAAVVAPTAASERIAVLDALRGFALFGIFLGNVSFFSGYAFLAAEARAALPTAAIDGAAAWLWRVLVSGKFYGLFSLLFGVGVALQVRRAEAAGRPFGGFFARRMGVLLGFGLLHTLLFFGDILALYAVVGVALLGFARARDRALLVAAAVAALVPSGYYGLMLLYQPLNVGAHLGALSMPAGERFAILFATEAWGELVRTNVVVDALRYADILVSGRAFQVLALFLVGYWVGRRGVAERLDEHRPLLVRTLGIGLGIGLPAGVVYATLAERGGWYSISSDGWLLLSVYCVGVYATTLAYAAGFGLLWRRPRVRAWLDRMSPAGRMALSNYILQSAAAVLCFYEVGAGLRGTVGPAWYPALALGMLAFNVVFGRVWLGRFRQGPLEWIWRRLCYRRPSLGREAAR